jgi:hypothetical protein
MSADQTAGRPLPAEESRGNISVLYDGQLFRNHDKLLNRITRLSIGLAGCLRFGFSQVEPIDAGPFSPHAHVIRISAHCHTLQSILDHTHDVIERLASN